VRTVAVAVAVAVVAVVTAAVGAAMAANANPPTIPSKVTANARKALWAMVGSTFFGLN
jgi:hypothetical protein